MEVRHLYVDSQWVLTLPALLFFTLLFAIGYTGFRTEFSIRNVEIDELGYPPPIGDQAKDNNILQLRQRIEQLILNVFSLEGLEDECGSVMRRADSAQTATHVAIALQHLLALGASG